MPINLSFSQRNGYEPVPTPLNPNVLTPALRNELLAVIRAAYLKAITRIKQSPNSQCSEDLKVANWHDGLNKIWVSYFKQPFDCFNAGECLQQYIEPLIKNAPLNHVFDLLEHLLNITGDLQPDFPSALQDVIQRHIAPYILRKNTDGKWEFLQTGTGYEKEIVQVAFASLYEDKFKTTSQHLERAGSELAKGEYPKCVLESAKALEDCLRILLNEPTTTLGDALRKYEKKFSVPRQFIRIFHKLYEYRGDASDVAHAKKEVSEVNQFDAQLYYVYCCGTISYLINKENSAV